MVNDFKWTGNITKQIYSKLGRSPRSRSKLDCNVPSLPINFRTNGFICFQSTRQRLEWVVKLLASDPGIELGSSEWRYRAQAFTYGCRKTVTTVIHLFVDRGMSEWYYQTQDWWNMSFECVCESLCQRLWKQRNAWIDFKYILRTRFWATNFDQVR